MCCVIDSFLSDLFTLVRRLFSSGNASNSNGQTTRTSGSNEESELERANTGIRTSRTGRTRIGGSSVTATSQLYESLEYKMMSKKGLLKFVKYTLIFSNAFGFILSIFLGLFGIAYPDKHFPLSYKGREMALCSLFCMLFTTIGYCGAQNHRRILLIIYGATNVIIVIIVVILWFLFRENSILGKKEISSMFITILAITIAVMFLFSFILAFHIQTFKDGAQDSIMSQSHQLLQQTTAFLQQQQQQHQQQQQQYQNQHHQLAAPQNLMDSGGGSLSSPGAHHHHQVALHHAGKATSVGISQQHSMAVGLGGQSASQQLVQHQQQLMQQIRGKPLQQAAGLISAAPAALQLPPPQLHSQTLLPPPQVPPPSSQQAQAPMQQPTLMRNQSSPLPGVPYQQPHSSTASRGASKTSQHYLSQKQQGSSNIQPPPSPPIMHHHHSMRDHQRMPPPPPVAGARIPSCPVQYCTFQCDRTV